MTGYDRELQTKPVTSTSLSTTAATTLQRVLPLCDLLAVQAFIAAGIITVGTLRNERSWYGAAIGLGVALVSVSRIRGLSMPRWVSARLGFWYQRRRRKGRTEQPEPFDTELPDGSHIGFYWDGKILTSLVRILE